VPLDPALILRAASVACAFATAPVLAEGQAGDFDFYVLSLSWLPTYCAGDYPDERQCDRPGVGFAVHGLWPQYEDGHPEYCPSSMPRWLADETVRMIRPVIPSASFARYQWGKHGMCTGLDEYDYFSLLIDAADTITLPESLDNGGLRLSPRDIESEFVDANPGLGNAGISVQCYDGSLTEVRICLTTDLAFRECAAIDADTCRRRSISIPAVD
jgi:ribonuclease T2